MVFGIARFRQPSLENYNITRKKKHRLSSAFLLPEVLSTKYLGQFFQRITLALNQLGNCPRDCRQIVKHGGKRSFKRDSGCGRKARNTRLSMGYYAGTMLMTNPRKVAAVKSPVSQKSRAIQSPCHRFYSSECRSAIMQNARAITPIIIITAKLFECGERSRGSGALRRGNDGK